MEEDAVKSFSLLPLSVPSSSPAAAITSPLPLRVVSCRSVSGNLIVAASCSGHRCRLRWLSGCRRIGSETAAVSVQPFFLRFESLWLLRKRFRAEVAAAAVAGRGRMSLWRIFKFSSFDNRGYGRRSSKELISFLLDDISVLF
ncbi:uncharacterized protein LOC110265354 [Arachis ipaensis]|uniref:uncharacterized protein LOC110265354 n=1 Tax=Arachis ipaensis TaxID=130454 RepID=UPI000A2B7A73|nr:uncharacterized protein LOC110265354 [Arachis ipaensis]